MREWLGEDHILGSYAEPRRDPPSRADVGTGNRYAEAALDNECAKVRAATEGQRNDTLNAAAFSLGQLVAGGELSESVVAESLMAAGLACGLDRKEVMATLKSGLEDGKKSPRSRPEQSRKRETENERVVTAGNDPFGDARANQSDEGIAGTAGIAGEPRPLRRETPPPEPFPIDALGDVLGAAARSIMDVIQCPDALAVSRFRRAIPALEAKAPAQAS